MAKYKEKVITGSEWVQLGKAKIFFSANRPTQISFEEEQVSVVDDRLDVRNLRRIDIVLEDGQTTFPLVKPDDNTPTGGDMSYKQLERAIYSLYYAKALELDAAVVPVTP
jgi:hypothetical protein